MAAHSRTRRHSSPVPITGYYKLGSNPAVYSTKWMSRTRTTSDVVGNYPNPNGFRSTTFSTRIGPFNGTRFEWIGGVFKKTAEASNLAPEYSNVAVTSPYSLPSTSEVNNAAVKGISKTSPWTPHVDVPTAIAELKDIPSLVRDWGQRLIRWRKTRKIFTSSDPLIDLAKGYSEGRLTWKWVIAPMLRDAAALFDFAKEADKRFKALKRLRNGGTISGKCPVSYETSTTTTGVFISTVFGVGNFVTATKRVFHSRRIWSSVAWRVPDDQPELLTLPRGDDELLAYARSLTVGVNSFAGLQTAWELLPWSWLIDWFANVGDSIGAIRNSLYAEPFDICVMCERRSNATYTVTSKPAWLQWTPELHAEEYIDRYRVVPATIYPFTPSGMPVLSDSQWLTLGNLAALRAR